MSKKNSYPVRSFINDIHLWLGLGSGIILFLVCLSGTLLAFEHEIKAYFTEEVEVLPSGNPMLPTELVRELEASDKGMVSGLTLPDDPAAPYEFSVKKDPSERRGTTLLVDPYTGKIHPPQKSSADGFFSAMFRLHRWLLLDTSVGRPIVGVATIIFLILALSGIVLWFPKRLRWNLLVKGFKIKTSGNWKRINHDLHNALGFYASLFIIVMGLTGLCWSFEGYREGLGKVIGAQVFNRNAPELPLNAEISSSELTLEEAMDRANGLFDYEGKLAISLPNDEQRYYEFRKYGRDNWSPVTYDRIYMDPSGAVLKTERFRDKAVGEQIAGLIKPLHTGEIFGTFSKTLYFLACLIATSLPVTGTLIWWNKLQKKKQKSAVRLSEQVA